MACAVGACDRLVWQDGWLNMSKQPMTDSMAHSLRSFTSPACVVASRQREMMELMKVILQSDFVHQSITVQTPGIIGE